MEARLPAAVGPGPTLRPSSSSTRSQGSLTRNGEGEEHPYELLPAQPGVGQIILQAKPIVIPVFVNGLPNALVRGLADTYSKNARREKPIIITFGQELDYSEYVSQKPRATLYKRCSDRLLTEVAALGEREHALRAACANGEISDDDPGWVVNRLAVRG
jgi:1-acyl-sn-glycerol-3-phosphate acyltransferase